VAEATELAAYDGEYVALAQEVETPLVTTDRAVLEAVLSVAVRPKDVATPEQ
jgi:predicted nucleic acid-binding protein